MGIRNLDHLNLTVRDLDESTQWYRRVFGFELAETGRRPDGAAWAILRSGEAMLCIYEHPERLAPARFRIGDHKAHAIYHVGFRITDREAWLAMVESEQLELEYGGEVSYPHSTSWYVADPTGYSIEVVLWNEDRVAFDPMGAEAAQR